MNRQQLANKIWAAANKMRSKIEANEYKDYILGFIFYRFLSEEMEQWLFDNGYDEESIREVTEEDTETADWIRRNQGWKRRVRLTPSGTRDLTPRAKQD